MAALHGLFSRRSLLMYTIGFVLGSLVSFAYNIGWYRGATSAKIEVIIQLDKMKRRHDMVIVPADEDR